MNTHLLSTLHIQLLDEHAALSLDELCRACAMPTTLIIELVEEGVLTPQGPAPESWVFSGLHLRRASVAQRLLNDLGLNLPGAALALQLLDEIDDLRAQLQTQRR